jgi:hypothetical protein
VPLFLNTRPLSFITRSLLVDNKKVSRQIIPTLGTKHSQAINLRMTIARSTVTSGINNQTTKEKED